MFWWKKYPREQLQAVLRWASVVAREDDYILFEFLNYRRYFYFKFPLRYNDQPVKTRALPENKKLTFIVRRSSLKIPDESWIKIFTSPKIEVYEHKSRAKNIPPLRWGLVEEEKKLALRIARDAIREFLESGKRLEREYFTALPPRFFFKTDLDVALWVDGHMRGSAVVEQYHLGDGIAEAAVRACRDARFKPLTREELLRTRIEITVFSDLQIPLSGRERVSDLIYPDKGYLLQKSGHQGWFLPEVFNVRRFQNLEQFLAELAEQKAGIGRNAYREADVSIFEVDDFIESENKSRPLSLAGPVIKRDQGSLIHNSEFIIHRLRMAADWLARLQEPDGNIPPIVDPVAGRAVRQIDWPRLAFTAWALAEFGKAVNEEKYLTAAEKSFEYLKNYLSINSVLRITNYELTLAYLGQLALSLGNSRVAQDAAEKTLGRLTALAFEPIIFAQAASFYKILSREDSKFRSPFQNLTTALRENFEKALRRNESMNLAVWAELVNTFWDVQPEFSHKVAEWLKKQQLPSGAFPESTHSDFVYVRGTGKIIEVLALSPEEYEEEIGAGLRWLLYMQYDEENTFFVPESVRPNIIGGFRHDYFNTEAWIDATGHVLLGGSRLIVNKTIWKQITK